MTDRVLADVVVAVHLLYIAFVVLGALLVARWPWVAWLHVPAALWGMLVELLDLVCPLTPLESRLRERAGLGGYGGDFIDRHLLPLMYPGRLTRGMQIGLGAFVVLLNALLYAWILHGWIRRRRPRAAAERATAARPLRP